MRNWVQHNKNRLLITILFTVLLLSGCITESITENGHSVQEPSKADMEKALNLYVQLAYQYIQEKNYAAAMSKIQKALEIDRKSGSVQGVLAYTYQEQGDIDKARSAYKKALRYDSKLTATKMNYGQFLFKQNEIKSACQQFKLASEDDFYAKRASAYYNLGLCEKALKNYTAANEAFVRCFGLDNSYTPALLEIANIKFEEKLYSEAKQFFTGYVEKIREQNSVLSPQGLWLGIRIERAFGNNNEEASLALFLKNKYPYSNEYLLYKKSIQN